jgi:hypothetical protein
MSEHTAVIRRGISFDTGAMPTACQNFTPSRHAKPSRQNFTLKLRDKILARVALQNLNMSRH